jgi:hypothetical protein
MTRSLLIVPFALATLALPSRAAAQRRAPPPSPSPSFWISGGAAAAWLRVSCAICSSDRGTALSAYVGLGGSAGRRTLVGAEASGRFKRDGGVRETVWSFNAVMYWYPNARRRLFWKTGAGVQLYRLEDGQDVLTANPFGVQVGIGWEHPLNRHLRLVPSATVHIASWGGGLKFNGASSVGDVALTMVQMGVGVTRR